jgi:hypothetical protein
MIATKTLVYLLFILVLIGLGLTVTADEWSGARRWKVGVLLLLIVYIASYGLR